MNETLTQTIPCSECNEQLGGLRPTKAKTLRCGARLLSLQSPILMGILNVTENSFYPQSRCSTDEEIAQRVAQIRDEGAAIIDVGACSTRPGSTPPTAAQEYNELKRAISIARSTAPELPISVDTYRADVAEKLLADFSVEMINDISGGNLDPAMFDVVAHYRTAYVLTHMQGTPATMQDAPHYENLIEEVEQFFTERVAELRTRGITDIVLDPGFGFGKSIEHNYSLLRNLSAFSLIDLPILAGLSRKSMIYKPLNTDAAGALLGTQVLQTLALIQGATILRVHDVRAAHDTLQLYKAYIQQPVLP